MCGPAAQQHARAARTGALVAHLRRPVSLRTTPGGHQSYGRLTLRTPFGSPQTLLVVRSSGPWLGVLQPVAGNNRVGWIPADGRRAELGSSGTCRSRCRPGS